MEKCPYILKFNGDGVEETGGFDYESCEIQIMDSLRKYDVYSSIECRCIEDNYKECPYYKKSRGVKYENNERFNR